MIAKFYISVKVMQNDVWQSADSNLLFVWPNRRQHNGPYDILHYMQKHLEALRAYI